MDYRKALLHNVTNRLTERNKATDLNTDLGRIRPPVLRIEQNMQSPNVRLVPLGA